jgi:D-alanyl-D-alanine carboxypeptidase/D-alanyl-D-alanine-endopeptidase (penicillin-binding protein 4)
MFKKLFIFILVQCFVVVGVVAQDANLEKAIDNLINQVDPDLNIGIKIINLETEEVLVSKNSNRYYIPGSSLKFISLVSLLDYFGQDYNFTSKILSQGKDYYFDIQDPEFKRSDLDLMVKELAEHAQGKIQGNIYIDDRAFSVPAVMYNKTYGDTLYCNSGPITQVHINKNCSKLDASPSEIGKRIELKVPRNFPYKVRNNAVTVEGGVLDRLYVSIRGDEYIVDGTLSKDTGPIVIGAVANDNLEQVKHYILNSLDQHNIRFAGKVLYGKSKARAKIVSSISRSIMEVVSSAMKKSDNFTTDYFLGMFATHNDCDKWEDAVVRLKGFIRENFQVDLAKASLYDASGISRTNLITPEQMSSFLGAVAKRPNFEFIKTIMACPGEECTLRDRFQGKSGIYTKTGSLSNVSALVGYFYKNNQLHSFVIMANNYQGSGAVYKKLEEDIVEFILNR